MAVVLVARDAMATRFEVLLRGEDPVRLRAAAEEALDEVTRLDRQLSYFDPGSDVRRVNAQAGRVAVPVEAGLFRLLQVATQLWRETDGAFDLTVAPLMRAWGFRGGGAPLLKEPDLVELRRHVGMQFLDLDARGRTVAFRQPRTQIDLGAIGKGVAVEAAGCLLRDAGVPHGIIHGGTSTIFAWGCDLGAVGWRVGLPMPDVAKENRAQSSSESAGLSARCLGEVTLRDEALSVSAIWGRVVSGVAGEVGHVMDPHSARPASDALMAAVIGPSAIVADALSTALLVGGESLQQRLRSRRPEVRSLLVLPGQGGQVWRLRPGPGWDMATSV